MLFWCPKHAVMATLRMFSSFVSVAYVVIGLGMVLAIVVAGFGATFCDERVYTCLPCFREGWMKSRVVSPRVVDLRSSAISPEGALKCICRKIKLGIPLGRVSMETTEVGGR